MRVTKSHHDAPKGIQLAFDPELSHEGLKKYLGALGFKEANRKKGVWYIRGNRPSYDRYTDALEKAYNEGVDVMEIFIQPSYEPGLDNITHKMFSLVTATITTDAKKTTNVDYVIFEDFRVSALDIANRYLQRQYGDRLQSVQVTAKNLKGRAEKAFEKGNIIVTASAQAKEPKGTGKEHPMSTPAPLTKDSGVYTEALAGDRYERLQIPMPAKLKFEASIELVRDEEDQYVYGLNVINNLSGYGGYAFAPSIGDATYSTKTAALQAALLQILDGVRYEYTEALRMGASEALQAAYKKTILAIYDFADRIDIKLPEEKSKAVLPLSIDEEEPGNGAGTEQSTPDTLDEDVAMLVDELRELETQAQDKGIAFRIGNVKIDLEESFQNLKGKLLNDQLKRIYSSLLEIGDSLSEGRYRDQFFTTLKKLEKKARVIPFTPNKNFQFTIIQGHTTLDDALIAEFQSFIELHRNTLHITYLQSKKDGALSILKVRISSDRDTISFLHRKEDNTIKIDGLNLHEESMVSYNGGAVPMGKLKKAIRYMLDNPQSLRIRPAEVYRLSEYTGAVPTDIVYNGKPLPNVLVPEGVTTDFDFGSIPEKSKNDIKAAFPWVFEIDDDDLIYVIPSQLFILSQFSDVEDLGIQVSTQDLEIHWLYYGERLFELLGYPTDMDYPYVDVHLGYYQVATLGEIVMDVRNTKDWWKVPQRYRPIADLEQAVQHIDEIIGLHQQNPEETTTADSDTATKLVAKYKEQRKKIQEYITTYGNPYGTTPVKTTTDLSEIETEAREVTDAKVDVADITHYKTFTPNVLIPKGIIAPFDSGSLSLSDAEEIRKTAPHLLAVTDENLGEQDAKTMFELSQMPHPKDYGFAVNRSTLLRDWEKRGKSLLEDLGYPTDLEYPYVNIHTGYTSVSPLGNLIDVEREANPWWSVVEHTRPIADMQKALDFIDQEIKKQTTLRDTYTNPKTGKPKTKQEDKEQYRSLTFTIENFEGSRGVIQQYLELQKDKTTQQHQIEEQETAATTNIKKEVHFSNVMIPERVVPPFDSGDITPEEAVDLKAQFFYLFEHTYRTMHRASPLELFMLLQFRDLKASGISITQETLYRIWEKEGQSLLAQLGFPTTPSYPYVHMEKGYLAVVSLEVIISRLPGVTIWWSAVKHYRPIANIEKALQYITGRLDILGKELEGEGSVLKKESLSKEINLLQHSKNHLEAHLNTAITPSKPISKENKVLTDDAYREIPEKEAGRIRKQFRTKGFKLVFTGKAVFDRNLSIVVLHSRAGHNQTQLAHKLEKEYDKWIAILEKEIKKLAGKTDSKSNQSRTHREERISALQIEREGLIKLVAQEATVFYDELLFGFIERAKAQGYTIDRDGIADFRLHMMTSLFEGRMLAHYPDMRISKAAYLLIDDYFGKHQDSDKTAPVPVMDYLDRVIAIMHDHYIESRRLSQKKIEAIKEEAGVPNMGVLWEAVELSWLLWYKTLYKQPGPFDDRLRTLVRFWDKVQPTYAYSDSSKEQYKQYSTPCPIGAMIAEYTNMADAASTFEPSAGNGLLVVGADPAKTHVNEIDHSRRKSLEFQGFAKITHYNAAEPFPDVLTHTFDVVVTNPPFDRWSADAFDKDRLVKKYFDSNIGLNRHLRLEHLMSGLALHTMKDSGKAALIIKGHIKFREDDGYMSTYKPFFNWLYSRYVVDDIINMNGYKLYNKQGAVTEMMLILIGGRKPGKSKKVAPNREQAGYLSDIAESFEALWERIKSHIKTPLQKEIEKLKIALGYDIF